MRFALLFALFIGGCALHVDDAGLDGVKKVIKMMKDMITQLESEAAQDDEVMEKMQCWCTTNDAAKTKAIADAKSAIEQLTADIESYTSLGQQLKEDLEQLAKDVSENEMELAQATSIREKEHEEFVDAEKDQKMSIVGLTKAVEAIGKATGSFTQVVKEHLSENMNQKFLQQMAAFHNMGLTSFLQTGSTVKAPASSEVFGVLKQMKESFETSLKDSQTDEADAQKAFDDMKAAKDGELQSARDMIDSKSKQSAETVEKLAQAKADLEDTTKQLAADEKFLADLKERCGNMEEEFAARKKMRTEEIAAVSEALGILNSDEAHDQMNKSLKFIQTSRGSSYSAARMKQMRTRTARLFLEAGIRLGSPRLSELAVATRGDVFAKVKKAIDDMLTQLKQEQKDEMKHRDWCIEELNSNERETDEGYDQQKALGVQHEELTLFLKNVGSEIAASKEQIYNTLLEMKHAGENRVAENKDFQETIADQKATQVILKKALTRLEAFYKKKAAAAAAFIQAHSNSYESQAPPPGFGGGYKKSGAATGVLMMIEGIIKESERTEETATKDEQEAQAAYEGFVKESNNIVDALNQGIAEKTEAEAKADVEIARTKKDQEDNMVQLEELHNVATELHQSCDFTLKNYETRQNARAAEMEALSQGKMILSGADPALVR